MKYYEHFDDDEDEEYPKGEELEPDEKPQTMGVLPCYKDFRMMAFVEYHLLKNNRNALPIFLKAQRVPHAKQDERDVKKIYSEAENKVIT